ncbi:hypothetical protein BD779DRAFT_1477426 [Infundibulicybe gibba]|nr:hypothetical protein BD779DRAFT_1477426 [Infundibulicybe gibba]
MAAKRHTDIAPTFDGSPTSSSIVTGLASTPSPLLPHEWNPSAPLLPRSLANRELEMARRFYSTASHRIQSTTHSFIVGPLHLCLTRHHQSSCIPTTTTRLHHLALSEDRLGEPSLTGTNPTPPPSLHSAPATTHPATPPARALVTPPLAIPPLAILLAHPHPLSPPPTGPHHYRRRILLQTRANGRGFDELCTIYSRWLEWLGPSSCAPSTLATVFAASIDAHNDAARLNGRTWAVVSARVVHANGCAEGLARACPPSRLLTGALVTCLKCEGFKVGFQGRSGCGSRCKMGYDWMKRVEGSGMNGWGAISGWAEQGVAQHYLRNGAVMNETGRGKGAGCRVTRLAVRRSGCKAGVQWRCEAIGKRLSERMGRIAPSMSGH